MKGGGDCSCWSTNRWELSLLVLLHPSGSLPSRSITSVWGRKHLAGFWSGNPRRCIPFNHLVIFSGSLHGILICTDVQTRALPHSLCLRDRWSYLTFHVMQISETLLASDLEFDTPSPPPVQDEGEGEQRGCGPGQCWEAWKRGAAVRLV